MRPVTEENQGDEWTERLAGLFREHPAWLGAAGYLHSQASSTVYFEHLGRVPWRLEQHDGASSLRLGAAADPDLVFRFTLESIDRLAAVEDGVGDFAATLFALIVEDEVGLRIVASFPRLARRGYLGLLMAGGPKVLAFGVSHGVSTLGALRRFVAQLRSQAPMAWEEEVQGPDSDGR